MTDICGQCGDYPRNCKKYPEDCIFMEQKVHAYHYIGGVDNHILDVLNWIKSFEEIQAHIACSGMDQELEDQVDKIISRLTMEVGVRMTMLFP